MSGFNAPNTSMPPEEELFRARRSPHRTVVQAAQEITFEPDVPLVTALPFISRTTLDPEPISLPETVKQNHSFLDVDDITKEQIYVLENQHDFSIGLARQLGVSKICFPLRFWVVDNSGSMRRKDGHQVLHSSSSSSSSVVAIQNCSRWLELQQSMAWHAEIAGLLHAPTVFRMLNDPGIIVGPQEFSIAYDPHSNGSLNNYSKTDQQVQHAKIILRKSQPDGATPLTEHAWEVYHQIRELEASLRDRGQKVAIVFATDGLPSGPNGKSSDETLAAFVEALEALQSLPVWITIRLCTDAPEVVNYYNELDQLLEMPLDVIDDFFGEAQEVYQANPWLTYALPLHRMREMGVQHRVFDILDEQLLSREEVMEFARLLFGEEEFLQQDESPDCANEERWKKFLHVLATVVTQHGKKYNIITGRMDYWIDMKQLRKCYKEGFQWFGGRFGRKR